MNNILTIPNSLRKAAALLAIVSLLATSLPISVFTAFAADTLFGPSDYTLQQGDNFVSTSINASGHENLVFSFDYDAQKLDASPSPDTVTYGWRENGGSDNDLGTIVGLAGESNPSEIDSVSVSLPPSAQVANLEVYAVISANTSGPSDEVYLTNITVSGDVATPLEENVVCDSGCEYTSLADAVVGENAGETITLKNQVHTITSNITVNKALTIVGEAGSVIQTSGGNIILTITADGVVLDSLDIQKSDSVNQNIIQINANDVTVQNSSFSGTYTAGDGQVTRAFEVVGGKTGLLLTGNTISNLRQPAYINNTTSGSITNNHVVDTKGWVIVSDTDLDFTGNSWGSNAVDIAIISQNSSANNYTCEIVAQMVADNNNAVIDNQVQTPACPPEPVAPPTMPVLSGQVIYDAIPSPLPSSVPSLGYQATQTYEFGDKITFEPLTGRELVEAAVTLTSWACESGQWNLGDCETTPGATFSHSVTLNIYEVETDGSVGALITSKTQTFDIPYRPSADSTCSDTKQWKDTNGDCFNGYNHVVVFDMTGVTVPNSVIYGIEYNTQSYGDSPIGSDGPYNSLNVGLNTDEPAPYIGTDIDTDEVFWNQNNSGFEADDDWSPYKVAVSFTAVEVAHSEIISPEENEFVSDVITLEAFYFDENGDGNDNVQWAVRYNSCSSGNVLGNVGGLNDPYLWNGEDFTATFDTTTVANGDYCFVFNPSEDSGDVDQRLTRMFTVDVPPDTESPVVTITSPIEGEAVNGEIDVTGTVTDDDALSHYVVTLYPGTTNLSNGLPHGSAIAVPGWGQVSTSSSDVSFVNSLDTTTLADGEYQIRVAARDDAGNRDVTDPYNGGTTSVHIVRITVDNQAPTITVKPESVSTGPDTFKEVSFKLYDEFMVDKLTLNGIEKDLTDNQWSDLNFVVPGAFGAVVGENTLVLYDVAGNSTTYIFTLVVDTEKPNVTIITPDDGAILTTGTVMVMGTSSDADSDIEEVLYTVTEIDGIGGSFVANIDSGTANGEEDWDFDVDLDTPGFYRLKVQAFDESGNWRYKYHDVEVRELLACTMTSDTGTVVVENNDYAVETWEHNNWTASIPGATWIWETFFVEEPEEDAALTFQETFTVTDVVDATLHLASDNTFRVFINDALVYEGNNPNNFQGYSQKEFTDVADYLVDGENTLEIEVTSPGTNGSIAKTNPAGVLYKLVVNTAGGSCDITTEKIDDEAPAAPEITSPDDEEVFSDTPILNEWTVATDSSGIDYYQIAYRYDDGHTFGGTTCPDVTIDGDWVGCRDTDSTSRNHSPALSEEGGVTIWVRVYDNAGNVSDWSDPVHYYYYESGEVPNEAPTIPNPLFPANEQVLNGSDLYIEWGDSTDDTTDQSNLVYEYRLYLENPEINPGATIRYSKDYTGTTRHPVSGFAPGTPEDTYFWRVQACDESDLCSGWSDVQQFTVDNSEEGGGSEDGDMQAPAVPTGLGWNDSNNNPVADGGTTELVSGTAVWDANTEPDFSHYIYKYWNAIPGSAYNSTSTAYVVNNGASNSRGGSFNQGEGTHYFCVVAVDNEGNESECSDEFTIIYDTDSEEPTTSTTTVTVSGDTATAENQPGWLFNRDTSTQSPYSFVLGTSTIGTGSLFINPITNTINGNNDKFIAELFLLSPIAELDSLTYDFNIAAVDANDENEFYMSVYANFGSSSSTKYYDCRYSVVPTIGVVDGWTTVTFDPTQSYPVATRGGASASPYTCPASPAGMDILDAGSSIRAVALNVGDTSTNDLGVSGYFDNVVVVQTTGLHTETTIYDFELATTTPTEESTDTDGGGGGGGGSGGGSNNDDDPTPTVLGASTDSEMYDLLEEIKNRLAEFLLASYVSVQGQTGGTGGPASGAVLGDSIAQADAQLPQEDEENVVDEDEDTEPTVGEDEESGAVMNISWQNYYWLLVLLWLLSSAGALWRRNEFPETIAMRAVQGLFSAIALLLLAGSLFFGLAGAFWPALIVTIGAITAYFWSIEQRSVQTMKKRERELAPFLF